MPKMKSHKASRTRIRLTTTGKILRTQCGVRHLLAGRSPKRMRNLVKKTTTTTTGYVRRARLALIEGQPKRKDGPKYIAKADRPQA
ncbi:MAG: 50S ribosomal protein L35 [Planctomycetes bacterium]|nr:50S ribosomal protein L35 [Planctomycetota bacterium]